VIESGKNTLKSAVNFPGPAAVAQNKLSNLPATLIVTVIKVASAPGSPGGPGSRTLGYANMKYADGTEVRLGERVRISTGDTGIVVVSIDTNEFDPPIRRKQLGGLYLSPKWPHRSHSCRKGLWVTCTTAEPNTQI
jgi:hypothetical protein